MKKMSSWTLVTTLAIIALSSVYAVTYRVFNFDEIFTPSIPNQNTVRPSSQYPGAQPFVYNPWEECLTNPTVSTTHMCISNIYNKRNVIPSKRNNGGLFNFQPGFFHLYNAVPYFNPFFNRLVSPKYDLRNLSLKPRSPFSNALESLWPFPSRGETGTGFNVANKKNTASRMKDTRKFFNFNLNPPVSLDNVKFTTANTKLNSEFGTSKNLNMYKGFTEAYKPISLSVFNTVPVHITPATTLPYIFHKTRTVASPKNTVIKENTVNNSTYEMITARSFVSTPDPKVYTTDNNKITIGKTTTASHKCVKNTTINSKALFDEQRKKELLEKFSDALDKLDREFYNVTFNKLTSISPVDRRENGISFVQSGLFLSLLLMAISTDTDKDTKAEIDRCLHLNVTDMEKIEIIKHILSLLPASGDELKFRWATRLVLGASQNISDRFRNAASALQVHIGKVKGNETDEELARDLNRMIEEDSGSAIRDTFDPEELSGGVRVAALTTLYLRGRWRAAPTVLNGTQPFHDADGAPWRTTRMIRINDLMRYANLDDCHFKALEIAYSTPGLTLLILIPHGLSLHSLSRHVAATSLASVTRRMESMRVAATLPLYTLRMTLLLPSKLQALGVNKLMNSNITEGDKLRVSHAVQRLMFWSEAGRNAFKDDGIEWDETPELELVVDRPYLFYVRWHNITLMNGNFVL